MAELVKVTALVPEGLRRKARIKALGEGVSLSSVLRDFLEKWVENGRQAAVEQPKSP